MCQVTSFDVPCFLRLSAGGLRGVGCASQVEVFDVHCQCFKMLHGVLSSPKPKIGKLFELKPSVECVVLLTGA